MVQAQHQEFQSQRDKMLREMAAAVTGGSAISTSSRIQWFLGFYLFAYMKFFDETKPDDDSENFYMEREWRVLGNVQFSLKDVSRVILPEEFAKRFRADVPEYYKQLAFL
jgi:hypothetical protein